jgi:hypothetical protein
MGWWSGYGSVADITQIYRKEIFKEKRGTSMFYVSAGLNLRRYVRSINLKLLTQPYENA